MHSVLIPSLSCQKILYTLLAVTLSEQNGHEEWTQRDLIDNDESPTVGTGSNRCCHHTKRCRSSDVESVQFVAVLECVGFVTSAKRRRVCCGANGFCRGSRWFWVPAVFVSAPPWAMRLLGGARVEFEAHTLIACGLLSHCAYGSESCADG